VRARFSKPKNGKINGQSRLEEPGMAAAALSEYAS